MKNYIHFMLRLTCTLGTVAVLAGLFVMYCTCSYSQGAQKETCVIGAVLSEPIKPYQEALSSFQKVLKENDVEVEIFKMIDQGLRPSKALTDALISDKYKIWAGIGPQAVKFLWSSNGGHRGRRIYGMVLNPWEIIGKDGCGVPMNIPISQQVKAIRCIFRQFEKVGMLFDPRYNKQFFKRAGEEGEKLGLKVVPVPVYSKAEIKPAMDAMWSKVDAIWLIPDFTVISESVVRYVIKEGLANGTATIGYNRFFFHSGAAMSFVLDYGRIGQQMALMCLDMLQGKACVSLVPFFEIWLNGRTLKILALKASTKTLPNVRVMP